MGTALQIMSRQELALQGQQARGHLDAAAKHIGKFSEHKQAAAIILIAVRPQFKRHGAWGKWLDDNCIHRRTADRVMEEYKDPAKKESRQEKQAERDAEARAYVKRDTRGSNAGASSCSRTVDRKLAQARQLLDLKWAEHSSDILTFLEEL